jgi:enoyl-CoA hydratase/carnithine racemase
MPVLYEKRNHVGWLTPSRPEAAIAGANIFNEEIIRLCDEMASDPEVRAQY